MNTHADMLRERRVLELNANWQAIGTKTPEQAMKDMATGAFLGMVIEGDDKMFPVSWEEWLKLEPLDEIYCVHTQHRTYRLPTVVIAVNYREMPKKEVPLSRMAVLRRDGFKCGYTQKELTEETATIDHVVPRSKGGKTAWTNVVACHVEVNRAKGNRFNHEVGLKLKTRLTEPKRLPMVYFIKNTHNVPGWDPFLVHKGS